jgi:hypothetical protein
MTKAARYFLYDVAALAIHLKETTVDEIAREFPGRSKYQIQDALHNAAAKKLVSCIRRGRLPAIWGPYREPGQPAPTFRRFTEKPEPSHMLASCVWELGTPQTPRPQAPKGGWSNEQEAA